MSKRVVCEVCGKLLDGNPQADKDRWIIKVEISRFGESDLHSEGDFCEEHGKDKWNEFRAWPFMASQEAGTR